MFRHKINAFCSNPDSNPFQFQLLELNNDHVRMRIFDMYDFDVAVSGEYLTVSSDQDELKGQWLDNVNNYLQEHQTTDIHDLLVKASAEFADLPDLMDAELLGEDLDEILDDENEYLTDEEAEDLLNEELDSAIDKQSTLMKAKQQKVLASAQERKVKAMQSKNYVDAMVEEVTANGMTPQEVAQHKKTSNIMQLYLIFYLDGFTIGHTQNPNEKLKLRSTDDEEQKPILKSFQAGYVPREFCGQAKEVDVHMIYKQCNYADRFKSEEEIKKKTEEKKKNDENDQEKVLIDGLGEITEEELEEQKKLLEQFQKLSNANDSNDDDTKNDESKTKTSTSPTSLSSETTQNTSSTTDQKSSGKQLKHNSDKQDVFTRDPNFSYTLDDSKKSTGIQFIFSKGNDIKRERTSFNEDDTVHTLHEYAAKQFNLNKIQLSFGGKILKEYTTTLKGAGLTNASVRVISVE